MSIVQESLVGNVYLKDVSDLFLCARYVLGVLILLARKPFREALYFFLFLFFFSFYLFLVGEGEVDTTNGGFKSPKTQHCRGDVP